MNRNLQALSLTTEQGRWKELATKIGKDTLTKYATEVDDKGEFPTHSLQAIKDSELIGLNIPKELGGSEADALSVVLVIEALAKSCASTAMCYNMHITTLPLISILVNEKQIEKFINPILKGSLVSFCMSEPSTGSRLWHMESYADKIGQNYSIDSFKFFASSSGYADFYMVPVRSHKHSAPNETSIFMIDGKDKNINVIGQWNGMGLRGNASTPIHFKNCLVPEDHRLGAPDCGFSMLMAYCLPIYLVGLSAVYIGIAQTAYEAAVEYVKKRYYSDTKNTSAHLETTQLAVADMKIKIDQSRTMVHRAARLVTEASKVFDELARAELLVELLERSQEDKFLIEVAQVKVATCEMAISVTNHALQVCGGTAYKKGNIMERCFRDARAGSLMAPADDILKVILGKKLLGLSYPWDKQKS